MCSTVPFRLHVKEDPLGKVVVLDRRGGCLEARRRAFVRAIDMGAS